MAKTSVIADKYPQFMTLGTLMSAANTLTFGRVSVGVSIFDYAAFLLNRIEYYFNPATLQELVGDSDSLSAAITGSDGIADLNLTRPEVYDNFQLCVNIGDILITTMNGMYAQPWIHDFTNMPGGGILVPAQDIYLGMTSSGFVTAGQAAARVYYQVVPLKAEDYIELAQRLRVLST
jgi:hypothetical protein